MVDLASEVGGNSNTRSNERFVTDNDVIILGHTNFPSTIWPPPGTINIAQPTEGTKKERAQIT